VGSVLGSLTGLENITVGDLVLDIDTIRDLCGYRTGTASFTNGSTAVTGTDTVWTADMVGRYIRLDADGTAYKIASRSGDTSIALASAFAGVTGSGAYTILSDRIAEHVPLGVQEGDITCRFAWNGTIHDTLLTACEARTQDEFTITDGQSSAYVGDATVASVGDKNLDTNGHATFTAVLRPVTQWTFTASA